MTQSDIAKSRLTSQQLTGASSKTAIDLVSRFGAVQAQEYSQTKWGLGLRLSQLKDSDIEKNFTDGKILRTHILRPTWHFVAAEDIHWMLTLTAPRIHVANAYMYRKLELNASLFKRCNAILEKSLEGKKQRTRDDLNAEFKKNKIKASGHRLSYIMMNAELEGLICSGAREGNQFTYALLDERVSKHTSKTKEEALAELTSRYFFSRGPATVKDFSTWSGLTLTDCRNGLGMMNSKFSKIIVNDEEYLFPNSSKSETNGSKAIHLLPIYDEYIMGYKSRDAYFEFRNSIRINSQIRYDNMIVSDGQIVGTWKRTAYKKSIDVVYSLFKPFTKSQLSAFDDTIKRFGEFSGKEVSVLVK